VPEDANQVEDGIEARDNLPGFDAGDVHLGQADQFAERCLTESACAPGRGQGGEKWRGEGSRSGFNRFFHIRRHHLCADAESGANM